MCFCFCFVFTCVSPALSVIRSRRCTSVPCVSMIYCEGCRFTSCFSVEDAALSVFHGGSCLTSCPRGLGLFCAPVGEVTWYRPYVEVFSLPHSLQQYSNRLRHTSVDWLVLTGTKCARKTIPTPLHDPKQPGLLTQGTWVHGSSCFHYILTLSAETEICHRRLCLTSL